MFATLKLSFERPLIKAYATAHREKSALVKQLMRHLHIKKGQDRILPALLWMPCTLEYESCMHHFACGLLFRKRHLFSPMNAVSHDRGISTVLHAVVRPPDSSHEPLLRSLQCRFSSVSSWLPSPWQTRFCQHLSSIPSAALGKLATTPRSGP